MRISHLLLTDSNPILAHSFVELIPSLIDSFIGVLDASPSFVDNPGLNFRSGSIRSQHQLELNIH